MTADRKLKNDVRYLAKRDGLSYTAARRRVLDLRQGLAHPPLRCRCDAADLADPVPRTVGIGAHTTSVWLYACPACGSRVWAELTPDQYVDVRYLVDHPAMDPFTQASLPPVEGRWQPADGIRAFGVRSITEARVLFPDHDPACAYCEHGPNSVDCATRVPGPAEDAFVCRDCRTELARARIAADPRNHDDYGWEE